METNLTSTSITTRRSCFIQSLKLMTRYLNSRQRRPNKSLDRSADSLFLNLIHAAKVRCNRRARSTQTFARITLRKTNFQRFDCNGRGAGDRPRGCSIAGCAIFLRWVESRDAPRYSILTKNQERVTIRGARTHRWTRAEPAGLASTSCASRSCLPPRQLNRYAPYSTDCHGARV